LSEVFRYTVTDPDGCQSASPAVTISRSSLTGHVFLDVNNDGVQQATEAGIARARITLYILSGGIWVAKAVTFTDTAGSYSFTNLGAGIFRVVCTPPSGLRVGKTVRGTVNGVLDGTVFSDDIRNIFLRIGQIGINYNFAFRPVST
jgi:hypothetical protein